MEDKFYNLEEQLELGRRFETGDSFAGDELVRSNMRLVRSTACKLYGLAVVAGVDYLDLVSAGYLGLVVSRDRFNYRKGVKFSTYAMHRVFGYMHKEISRGIKNRRISIDSEKIESFPQKAEDREFDFESYGDFHSILESGDISERQKKVLTLRLLGKKTLEETSREIYYTNSEGEKIKVSRERVRQIQNEALDILRESILRR